MNHDALKQVVYAEAASIKDRLKKPLAFTIAAMVLFVPLFLYAGTIAAFLAVIVLAIFLGTAMSRQLVPLAAMLMVFTLSNRLIDLNLVEKSVTPKQAAEQVDQATKAAVAAALAQERARLALENREKDLQARAAKVDAVAEEQRVKLAAWEKQLNDYRERLEARRQEVARANLERTEPVVEHSSKWTVGVRKSINLMLNVPNVGWKHADYVVDCDGTGHPIVQMQIGQSSWMSAPEPIRTNVGQMLCKA